MISFSDWNALLLYADELEEKLKTEHNIKVVIRPYNNAIYEKRMAFCILDNKGNEFGLPYYTDTLPNLMDGKIMMAETARKIVEEIK